MAFKTTRWPTAMALLSLTGTAQTAWADDTAAPPSDSLFAGADPFTEPQLRASLSVLDASRQTLLRLRANVPAMLQNHSPDERGRTFADDWQAYCLNDSDQADIQAKFTAITDALDRADLKSADNLRQVLYHRLEVMGIQCKCIGDYWQEVVVHPPNWSPYIQMLKENALEPHYAVNLASLERTLKLQARQGLFIDAIGGTLTQLEGVRTRGLQRDLEELKQKAKDPDFHRLYPMTSTATCSPVAARSSGKSSPSMDYSQSQPKLNYPKESERNREQGRVVVGLIVPPSGCSRTGFVLTSSGFEQLDRAAVSHAMGLHLLPAEEKGAAVEALAVLPINYALRAP